MKFDFNDILITPAIISNIESRTHINPFLKNGFLPLITAPMDTVVNYKNYKHFLKNKINVCFPRNSGIKSFTDSVFKSYSLEEFNKKFLNEKYTEVLKNTTFVLIDLANGHMSKLFNSVKSAKERYGDKLFLMVGNVANPDTFIEYCNCGVDAVRVILGAGAGCLTSKNTGVGYSCGSLIKECYEIRKLSTHPETLIVADGGMQNYSDIIKALGLGADLVMIGGIFNKSLESCAKTKLFNRIKINPTGKFAFWALKHKFTLTKQFRGMSSKEVQKLWGNSILKTSEGVIRTHKVEYTLSQWTENFEDYLRSAMSYTNCRTLEDFKGKVKYTEISENSYKRFDK